MKKRIPGLVSLALVLISYFLFRYPLFDLHGMKSLPLTLCVVSIVIIAVTGIILSNKAAPVFTAIGYIIGFIAGEIFGFDYGIGLNNMWIIWVCCFIASVIIGGIFNLLITKKSKK